MRLGKYIKDRLYSVCIFVAMLIISVLMMAAFKVSVQLIIAEIFIMIIECKGNVTISGGSVECGGTVRSEACGEIMIQKGFEAKIGANVEFK